MKKQNRVGEVIGRLKVIGFAGVTKNGNALWECLCECGKTKAIQSGNLKVGHTMSCGCLKKEKFGKGYLKHGLTKTSTYHSWAGMIQRCTNQNHPHYKDYGGRGITVYEPWMKFENFLLDMGQSPPDCTIERIDNNKGYEPRNCCWATFKQQQRNRRSSKIICYQGKSQCLAAWAEEYNVKQTKVLKRLKNGWSIPQALEIELPPKLHKRSKFVEFNGQKLCIEDWSRITNIPSRTIAWRLRKGWDVEKALNTPSRQKYGLSKNLLVGKNSV